MQAANEKKKDWNQRSQEKRHEKKKKKKKKVFAHCINVIFSLSVID